MFADAINTNAIIAMSCDITGVDQGTHTCLLGGAVGAESLSESPSNDVNSTYIVVVARQRCVVLPLLMMIIHLSSVMLSHKYVLIC